MSELTLVGAVDPAGDPSGALRGIPLFDDLDALLARGIEACVVATPTATHVAISKALADAGVPTLLEKPVAATVQDAEEIVAAFAQHGVPACVGHIERYNPSLQALRTRLEAGELGDIYQVATRRQGPFPPRIGDVGVVMDLATHDIDLTRWVTGQDYFSVAAHTANRSGRKHEDLVTVLGLLADGTPANHLVNWLSPMKERVTVITGDRGCFVADTLAADLTFFANARVAVEWDAMSLFRGVAEGDMVRYAIAKPEPLRTELEQFARLAAGHPDARTVSLQDGLCAVQVGAAMLTSAESGQTIEMSGSDD
jgi:predicted dehydrogenase